MAELLKQIWLKGASSHNQSFPWLKQTDSGTAGRCSLQPLSLLGVKLISLPLCFPSTHSLPSPPPPPCPPRFCAQELHGEQQRRRTECQPPDSRQGLLGVDGLRPPERRGVRVLFVRGKSKFIPLRTATQEKEDKKKKPNKQKKTTPHASWLLTVSQ